MWGTKAQTHQQETRADKLPAQPPVQAGALADHFFNVVTESVHSWNIWRYFDTFERHVLRISKQCKDSRWLKYHCGVIFNKPLQFLLHHSFFFPAHLALLFFILFFYSCLEGISHWKGICPDTLPGIQHSSMYLSRGQRNKRPQWPEVKGSSQQLWGWGEKRSAKP